MAQLDWRFPSPWDDKREFAGHEPVTCANTPSVISQPKVIDSAVHVWSDGTPPFPWEGAPPPEALQSVATHESLAQLARGKMPVFAQFHTYFSPNIL
eukprot:scaffold21204_cov36-Phaeocystis_antarctica.AAC.1